MFQNIAYHLIFGIPVIVYGGLLAGILMLSTATVGFLIHRNLAPIPFDIHKFLALATVSVALAHGILAILVFFF
jgi:hypothetical protein